MKYSFSEMNLAAISLILANEIRAWHVCGKDYSALMEAYIALRRCLPKNEEGNQSLEPFAIKLLVARKLGLPEY